MFAILGSGFGLYGYLPALVDGCGQRIVLPQRYQPRYQSRGELVDFAPEIRWVPDEQAALSCATGAVLALRPADQETWIERCVNIPNLNYLLLEKPIARTPKLAQNALDTLIRSDIAFRIGYLFRFTMWGKQLFRVLGAGRYDGELLIHWRFCAHHYQHDLVNWKRYVSTGGGAIRFFGVHAIALLAELGYRNVTMSRTMGSSAEEIELWHAMFSGEGLPECEVVIDTRSSETGFDVACLRQGSRQPDVAERFVGPFDSGKLQSAEQENPSGLDARTLLLGEHCRTLWDSAQSEWAWYQQTLDLWRCVEEKSCFEPLDADSRPSQSRGSDRFAKRLYARRGGGCA